ncbi:MAG: hypothetical protein CMM58_02755 [Rhodospirillaceae bacterium]|nr:hypothetical protein [Rhodospirillaceae bacterium]
MKLSDKEIKTFWEEGFLLNDGFLEVQEIEHLKECYMMTVARLAQEGALDNVQSGDDSDDEYQVYQIRTAHLQHPIFRMLINDSRLLDIVECLIGPDIRLIHYQGIYKPAGTGGEVDWHQDNQYFNVENDRTITFWLALDDATVENGCMWYLPGGHKNILQHEQLWDTSEKKGFYFSISNIDDSGAVPAELPSGGLAIHHCRMPHRSLKNHTQKPRRGIAMHFMDARMPDPPLLDILPEGATPVLRVGRH